MFGNPPGVLESVFNQTYQAKYALKVDPVINFPLASTLLSTVQWCSSLFLDVFQQVSRKPLGIQKQMIPHLEVLTSGYF